MRRRLHPGFSFYALLLFCAVWACSCAAPLGPGYTVEKQEIRLQFEPAAQTIHVEADYQLRNTGNHAIRELEILLPARRLFLTDAATTKWDGSEVATEPPSAAARSSILHLATPWTAPAEHALHISYDIRTAASAGAGLSFASDSFYLPAGGWCPELPQIRGLFGFGGVPPKKWELVINVPEGFLVHSSGALKKSSRESKNNTQTFRAQQTVDDRYPFVIAGRYSAKEIRDPHQKIILWSRASSNSSAQAANVLQQASAEFARTVDIYNSIFGAPSSRTSTFWVVECPVPQACISHFRSGAATLLSEGGPDTPSAQLASSDTVMVDVSDGAPKLAAAAAPSLAASWLGYGRNPGFYEQTEPLSLLPVFFAARSREEIDGPQVRGETIRRALRFIPKDSVVPQPAKVTVPAIEAAGQSSTAPTDHVKPEGSQLSRAKSFLFFYALQDRYGAKAFHDAIVYMLRARAGRGFDLDDLIAALEQETHQNVASFVRLWFKHPGVPADFRARYEVSAASRGDSLPPIFGFHSKGATP